LPKNTLLYIVPNITEKMGIFGNYKVSSGTYVSTAIACLVIGLGIGKNSGDWKIEEYLRNQAHSIAQRYTVPETSHEDPPVIEQPLLLKKALMP